MSSPVALVRQERLLAPHCPPIAYVLSGGSAKGFCHLGMIEALEGRGVRPDMVVGTSAGALFGALYCHFGSVDGVYGRVEEVLASVEFAAFEKKYFGEGAAHGARLQNGVEAFFSGLAGRLRTGMHLGRALVTSAMVAPRDAAVIFGRLFEGISFESLKIPFAAVAVDLSDARLSVLTGPDRAAGRAGGAGSPTGGAPAGCDLVQAVMASSAIPFVFPSVEIGGHAHADGYIMANLPVREAASLFDDREPFLVGFDVSSPLEQADEGLSNVELALRLLDMATRAKQDADRTLLDVLFQPVEKTYPWSSFAQYRQFVDLGKQYMTADRLAGFERSYVERVRACTGRSLRGRMFLRPRIDLALRSAR